MSSHDPLVSVVMPVYNPDQYLSKAIESISKQTYSNFELIIISDDSSEKTYEVLEKFQKLDNRIKAFHQKRQGLIVSLNRGLDLAQGKYIARMDADDISHHCRFEIQVEFMESHPEIGVCGAWAGSIGENKGYFWKFNRNPETIRCLLLFCSPLVHPSVMIRRELLNSFNLRYNSNYTYAEDYQFWIQIAERAQIINIPQTLVYYRYHDANVSIIHQKEQVETTSKIHIDLLNKLGIAPSFEELTIHRSLGSGNFLVSKTYLQEVQDWLCKIQAANDRKLFYSKNALDSVLTELWCLACLKNVTWGLWTWRKFWSSPILKRVQFNKLLQIGLTHLTERVRSRKAQY